MINGNLKSLHLLWVNLARSQRYSAWVSELDITEFTKRVDNEGMTFLTTTLPRIGKALDVFHSTMVWNAPSGFKLQKDTTIPLFLGKAIEKSLAGHSQAVDCVRQLTLIYYKLEVSYDQETVDKFLKDFKRVDEDLAGTLPHLDGPFDPLNIEDETVHLVGEMRTLIGFVLRNLDPLDCRPYHGSGSTACRTKNYDKWHLLRYSAKLDAVFSYPDYFFFSSTHLADEYLKLERSEELTPCARIVLVPKDSRGPRVISCEPAEHMYIQQGLMRLLYRRLETHPLTSGFVNFTNQLVNRKLARQSSMDNELATLDLSEASDRVSWKLVQAVFPPEWVEALDACRTPRTLLPNGEVVELNKFAPMGSSCCFPVEALVFWACASAYMHYASNGQGLTGKSRWLNYRLGASFSTPEEVYVYGDDIIIPSRYTDGVIKSLESIGLKVNRDKTYSSGPFRESCGGDYHLGVDVTPVRVRSFLSSVGTGLATAADLCNEVIAKFGEIEAAAVISVIETAVGYVFPRTDLPYPGCIRMLPRSSNDVFFKRRYNKDLQRFEHRVLAYKTRLHKRRQATWCELLRKELSRDKPRSTYSREEALSSLSGEQSATALPGDYADPYSAQQVWKWTWLGSSQSFTLSNHHQMMTK